MFKEAIIHYPENSDTLKLIYKEIANLRCLAVVQYVELSNLNDNQIEMLFTKLLEETEKKLKLSA